MTGSTAPLLIVFFEAACKRLMVRCPIACVFNSSKCVAIFELVLCCVLALAAHVSQATCEHV